ncbi:hypothetical protein [Gordonia sp. (in: high G+C Gram-positive bacteria)]|uniref:hypothetical protein n=1 Tax=unclassified Gordonia (in: high G+C Gram-positive bacteria) TaxID=2657482 RepID=UPI002632DBA3|nr:hypothetical protein [Gordonia sp. (in: high G+C Gram-positive bacteria)]
MPNTSRAPAAVATVIMAVIGILAFAAPWVVVKADETSLFTITLSRRAEGVSMQVGELSGSPGWAISLAVLLVITALRAWNRPVADDSAGVASSGAVIVLLAVLFTWLGRSVWLNTKHLPDGVSMHMGWAYYVSLALAVALFVVPWVVAAATEE